MKYHIPTHEVDIVPPSDVKSEEIVIGSVLLGLDGLARIRGRIAAGDFYDRHLARVYTAACQAADQHQAIDPILTGERLKASGHLDEVGGYPRLMQLHGAVASATNIERHAAVVLDRAQRRRLLDTVRKLQEQAHDLEQSVDQLINSGVQAVSAIRPPTAAGSLEGPQMAEAAKVAYDDAVRLRQSGRDFVGLDTGFGELNDKLNGLCPAEMTVLAARTSIGKTTLAQQIALHAAEKEDADVAFFSLEMSPTQVSRRFVSLIGHIDPMTIRKGMMTPSDQLRFGRALETLSASRIRILTGDRTTEAIASRVRQLKRPERPLLVVVDHLHRVADKGDSDYQRLGMAAFRLAELAVQQEVHVLLLAQLNRQCEQRPGKKPQLADLRDSGSIEEHAANVLLIYRPGFYDDLVKGSNNPDLIRSQAFLHCEKTREAEPGVVNLGWDTEQARFCDTVPTLVPSTPAARPHHEREEE